MGVIIPFIIVDEKSNCVDINIGSKKEEIEKINKMDITLEEKIKLAGQLLK